MSRILSDTEKDFILVRELESIGEETSPLAISDESGKFRGVFKFVFYKIIIPAQ